MLDITNKFDYTEHAINGTATKTTTTNIDLKITTEKTWINGGAILYKNAAWGDYITAQVVDKDNVLGYGSNVVLAEYITKRYIHPDEHYDEIELPYAGEIPQNTYLRIKYTSVGTSTDVDVAANYFLHKVL